MSIEISDDVRKDYNSIAELCRKTGKPVYLTRDGERELVVMDIESFVKREEMLHLREKLMTVEGERISGVKGYTVDELDDYLGSLIAEIEHIR